jgi:hypothetical protein
LAQPWNRWSLIVHETTRRIPLWDTISEADKADLAHAKVDLDRFRACIFMTKRLVDLSRVRIQESQRLIALVSKMEDPKISN